MENMPVLGYNWCVEAINSSGYAPLAGDLEINKAVTFLKQNDIPQAMETLKTFQRKESKVASTAASNMAFVHFLVNTFGIYILGPILVIYGPLVSRSVVVVPSLDHSN